ncbi:MAG TPA: SGNH/GDSL hydrolase family protein, partial [Thermoanaerobaculia bacterium]
PQDETFVSRLQRALDARYGAAFEIVNLAIFAYDTRNELDALAEDGLAYRPGLVVVQFYMNDLSLAPPPTKAAAAASWSDRLTAVKNRVLFSSALYRRAHQAVTGLGYLLFHDARRRYFAGTLNTDEPRADRDYLAARPDDRAVPTFAALASLADLARRHGARLLVVISPDEVQLFDRRYDLINQRVGTFCHRQGIEVFDALPALRASASRTALFYDGVHYSERGHALMARLLFTELVRRRLLPV